MNRFRNLALVAVILLGILLTAPWSCSAQMAQITDIPLLPVGSPGFVDLVAFRVDSNLMVLGEQWAIATKHTYQLHNTDRIKAATLRLGLAMAPDSPSAETEPVLTDADGNALVPIGMDAIHQLIWEIQLAPNESRILEYSYTTYPSQAETLQWTVASGRLSEWGIVQGINVTWSLPTFMSDQAMVQISPSDSQFDGRQVIWTAEALSSPNDVTISMWAPQLWAERQQLLSDGNHTDLGHFYQRWAALASSLGLEMDFTMEILAEYQAALVEDPQNLGVRSALAQVYLDLAARKPNMSLNYLVIAAHELEAVHAANADDGEATRKLLQIYDQAAALAGAMGDPAGALVYLTKPVELSAQAPASDTTRREELALQWALDLAEQGQIDEALVQLSGRLAPAIEDAIIRYAPPFMSAATHVTMSDRHRKAIYDLYLYLPTAKTTGARLSQLAEQLSTLEQCSASVALDQAQATVTLDVTYGSLEELEEIEAEILANLAHDPDLLSVLLETPWQGRVETWAYSRTLWQDQFAYQELVDKGTIDNMWQTDAQYAEWRLIELADALADTDRARMEKRLAQIALNEQRLIWEYLPRSSYWVYAIEPDNTAWSKNILVPWGQQRSIEAVYSVYRWRSIFLLAASSAIGLVVLGVIALWVVKSAR